MFGFQSGSDSQDRIHSGYAIVNTPLDLANPANEPHVAFHVYEASDMADCNVLDDFMRATIATPNYGLAAMFGSGRINRNLPVFPLNSAASALDSQMWRFDTMAQGEHLGASLKWMGDANSPRDPHDPTKDRRKHLAIMGDPSLRLHILAPPVGPAAGGLLSVTANGAGITAMISWNPSSDIPTTSGNWGYHVYRATSPDGPFTASISGLVSGTSFTDPSFGPGSGTKFYAVRAAKLTTSGCGSYWNLSQSTFSF